MKHIAIYILFAVTAPLVLLNRYTSLYISNYWANFAVLFIASATFVIIVGHFFNKFRSIQSQLIVVAVVGIICYSKGFLTWSGDWKTQTILFEDRENPRKTIDFQMRGDRFAFGYKKRVVEVYRLAPYVQWTTGTDTLQLDHARWAKKNTYTNELDF